jgi:hypothetical protein
MNQEGQGPSDPKGMHDLEVMLLRMLPWYLRGLNQQGGHFKDAHRNKWKDQQPDPIKRAKLLPKKRKSN